MLIVVEDVVNLRFITSTFPYTNKYVILLIDIIIFSYL